MSIILGWYWRCHSLFFRSSLPPFLFFLFYTAQIEQMLKQDWLLSSHCRYYVREMRILAYTQLLESYRSLTLQYMADAFSVSEEFIDKWVWLCFVTNTNGNAQYSMTGPTWLQKFNMDWAKDAPRTSYSSPLCFHLLSSRVWFIPKEAVLGERCQVLRPFQEKRKILTQAGLNFESHLSRDVSVSRKRACNLALSLPNTASPIQSSAKQLSHFIYCLSPPSSWVVIFNQELLASFSFRELSRFIAAGRLNCKIDKVRGVVETNR